MAKEYDTSEPIVIMVRPGGRGRGFLVAPLDSLHNMAPCTDEEDLARVIVEMLTDPKQPRVDQAQLFNQGGASSKKMEPVGEEYEEEEYEDEEEEEEDEWPESMDPADRLLAEGISKIWGFAQDQGKKSRERRAKIRKNREARNKRKH